MEWFAGCIVAKRDLFDLTPRGIRDRLEKLEKEGTLESKKVGARAIVWWDPEHTTTSGKD
ncbi:hypothetical protein [Salinibaculum salinum]|uniref:hypothetical protein n=1 Tax=Salinibaculum salinum TaxID=3131996 RepID=UPI0030EEEB65